MLFDGRVGTDGVLAARTGEPLEAFELLSTDADGWPHVAWLSPGELFVVDAGTVRWCLWPESTTSANLAVRGRAMLQAVIDRRVLKVRFDVSPRGAIEVSGLRLSAYEATVVDGTEDAAPYAEVLSGLRYQLRDPEAVADRWDEQVRQLAALTPPTSP